MFKPDAHKLLQVKKKKSSGGGVPTFWTSNHLIMWSALLNPSQYVLSFSHYVTAPQTRRSQAAIRNQLLEDGAAKQKTHCTCGSLSHRSFNSSEAGLLTSDDLLCSKLRRRQLRRSGLIIIRADVSQASLRAFENKEGQTKEAASTKWDAKKIKNKKNPLWRSIRLIICSGGVAAQINCQIVAEREASSSRPQRRRRRAFDAAPPAATCLPHVPRTKSLSILECKNWCAFRQPSISNGSSADICQTLSWGNES